MITIITSGVQQGTGWDRIAPGSSARKILDCELWVCKSAGFRKDAGELSTPWEYLIIHTNKYY